MSCSAGRREGSEVITLVYTVAAWPLETGQEEFERVTATYPLATQWNPKGVCKTALACQAGMYSKAIFFSSLQEDKGKA